MIKLAVVLCSLLAGFVFFPGTALAASTNCTVTSVGYQKPITGVPTDILVVSCSNGTSYNAYVGTTSSCNATPDTVKAWQSIALSARLSGKTLTIYWNTFSCPGNAGARIIESLWE